MAIRQLGPGGPTYQYDGRAALDAPHSNISKVKIVGVSVDIAAHVANTPLETTVTLPAGTCSSRAICLSVHPSAAVGTSVALLNGRVSAADTVVIQSISNLTTNPAAQTLEFVLLEP